MNRTCHFFSRFKIFIQSSLKRLLFLSHEKIVSRKFWKGYIWIVCVMTYHTNMVNHYQDLKCSIFITELLRERVLAWYHKLLNHPGSSIIYSVISQYLTWSSMKTYVEILVKTFHKFKKFNKKPTGLMEIFHSMNLKYFHGSPIMLT